MPRLHARSFENAGIVRTFPNGSTTVIRLDETVVGYGHYEPGWRWSVDMPAIAGSPTCQLHHVGYAVSGVLHVLTDAGQEMEVQPHSVYEIPPGHDLGVALDSIGDAEVVTILFTDIVESTATLVRLGDQAWRDRLARHHGRMRDHLNEFRGREIKSTGDGLLAVFDRPIRAVRCAQAMVATSRSLELPLRVGIHVGEVELAGDDARGLAIHTAARIMSLGRADDVMVSSTVRELLEGSGIELADAGEHELKGLPGARRIFRVEP
jgi:class 3 adenylate cyclase